MLSQCWFNDRANNADGRQTLKQKKIDKHISYFDAIFEDIARLWEIIFPFFFLANNDNLFKQEYPSLPEFLGVHWFYFRSLLHN